MTKRNLFAEITEGFKALDKERAGRKTLHTHELEWLPVQSFNADQIISSSNAKSAESMQLATLHDVYSWHYHPQ